MDGMLNLFFLWSIWIYASFIMGKKDPLRFPIAVFALVILNISPFIISIFSIEISGSAFILLLINYFLASKFSLSKKLFLLFSATALMIGYTGLLLFEMYDPIWVFIDRKILFCFGLLILSYFIYPSSLFLRMVFVCLGTLHGEIMFSIILLRWNMPYLIGTAEYLDILAMTFSCLIFMHAAVKLLNIPSFYSKRKMQQ